MPKHRRKERKNNFGEGFEVAGIIALVAVIYYNGIIPYVTVYLPIQALILSFYFAFSIISLALAFISARTQKSLFGTWGNGFFIGGSAVFDLLGIAVLVVHGKFPLPYL